MPQPDTDEVHEAVRRTYADVASSADGRFRYATGRAGAKALQYDAATLALPDDVLEGFCGVGNPFDLGPISAGQAFLDVGCGAGIDLIVASRLVAAAGSVHGVDLTPQMVAKARANLERVGATNARVEVARSEEIPYPDSTFDVASSNGVFNLSPRKEQTFAEIYRVLRPGGRLQFADIVSKQALSPELTGDLDAWAGWIGGAVPVGTLIELLAAAGFKDVEYVGETPMTTSPATVGALLRARK